MISFIVPAYNEANQIATVVRSIIESAESIGLQRSDDPAVLGSYEVIGVDDDSDDDTAHLAADAGAQVLHVEKRQIAAVRNAGARAARGSTLIFLDGDTWLNPDTLVAAIDLLDRGAIGGGACVLFDHAPRSARIALTFTVQGLKFARCCGGCFLFTTKRAFEAVGGFDESLYASEEVALAKALGRLGRFVILTQPVVTSGRKVRRYTVRALIGKVVRMGMAGPKAVQSRDGLEIWYDGVREA